MGSIGPKRSREDVRFCGKPDSARSRVSHDHGTRLDRSGDRIALIMPGNILAVSAGVVAIASEKCIHISDRFPRWMQHTIRPTRWLPRHDACVALFRYRPLILLIWAPGGPLIRRCPASLAGACSIDRAGASRPFAVWSLVSDGNMLLVIQGVGVTETQYGYKCLAPKPTGNLGFCFAKMRRRLIFIWPYCTRSFHLEWI